MTSASAGYDDTRNPLPSAARRAVLERMACLADIEAVNAKAAQDLKGRWRNTDPFDAYGELVTFAKECRSEAGGYDHLGGAA